MQYKILTLDVESYPNYLLLGIKDTKGEYHMVDNIGELEKFIPYLQSLVFCGYNSINYDSVIMDYVLTFYKIQAWEDMAKVCHRITKEIIHDDMSHFAVRKKYRIQQRSYHVDVSYYCSMLSLKEMGIRMHHDKLETLPIDPNKKLSDKDIEIIKEYNKNDLDITYKLMHEVKNNDMNMKQDLIDGLGLSLDYYAKTDGVIAEEMLCDRHKKPIKKDIIRYKRKQDFNFNIQELMDLVETYEGFWFSESDKFKTSMEINGLTIEFGVGGVHACVPNYQGENLIDIDVASYYPNIIRNNDVLPHTVRNKEEYYHMIDERVKLKKTDKKKANAFKIILNAIFGKMKYKNSKLYDVEGLYAVTITGQLLIARLLEDLTLAGYRVIYVNTDGLMIEANDELGDKYNEICAKWEEEFNYVLEYTKVKRAWIRDVSNYILEVDGSFKTKGDYLLQNDRRNNAYHRIVWKAVFNKVAHDIPIEETVRNSKDICDFVLYTKFGNAYTDTKIMNADGTDEHFEKVLRYYWCNDRVNFVTSTKEDTGGNKNYDDATNICTVWHLSDFNELGNIDYNRYINRAYQKLGELLGVEMESNYYIERIVESLPFEIDYLSAGVGKKKLNKPLLSPDTTTVNLKSGSDTGYLVLDIDNPYSKGARDMLKQITLDNFIVYSSEYSIEDVLSGKCKYKVIFKYDGKDIPRKKKNIAVECFYKHPIAIAGRRDDGYEYVNNNGKVREIYFDINDYLEETVPFKFL